MGNCGRPALQRRRELLIGSYGDTRGNGADFAIISAVLGIESPVRALIAALGVILVFTAFFWLPFSLMAVDEVPVTGRLHLGTLFGAVAAWRRVVSLILLVAVLAVALLGLSQVWAGSRAGVGLLAGAIVLWGIAVALLVPWRDPGPAHVFSYWLAPGLVGGALLVVFGALTNSDYMITAPLMVPALVTVAWTQIGARAAKPGIAPVTEDKT